MDIHWSVTDAFGNGNNNLGRFSFKFDFCIAQTCIIDSATPIICICHFKVTQICKKCLLVLTFGILRDKIFIMVLDSTQLFTPPFLSLNYYYYQKKASTIKEIALRKHRCARKKSKKIKSYFQKRIRMVYSPHQPTFNERTKRGNQNTNFFSNNNNNRKYQVGYKIYSLRKNGITMIPKKRQRQCASMKNKEFQCVRDCDRRRRIRRRRKKCNALQCIERKCTHREL